METITEQDSQQKLEKLLDFCQVRIPQYHTMLCLNERICVCSLF